MPVTVISFVATYRQSTKQTRLRGLVTPRGMYGEESCDSAGFPSDIPFPQPSYSPQFLEFSFQING